MRTLPNKSNNFNGHGQTIATVESAPAPKTIRRLTLATGHESLISEAQAYGETFDSFGATTGAPHSQALTELLAEGARVATTQALYWLEREGTYCPVCEQMSAQLVESFGGDHFINGQLQGVDLSRYVCPCGNDWWD